MILFSPALMSKKSVNEVFADFRKKYGDIFSLKFGKQNVIVLNTIEVVKEALVKKAVEFAGRPKTYSRNCKDFKRVLYSFNHALLTPLSLSIVTYWTIVKSPCLPAGQAGCGRLVQTV